MATVVRCPADDGGRWPGTGQVSTGHAPRPEVRMRANLAALAGETGTGPEPDPCVGADPNSRCPVPVGAWVGLEVAGALAAQRGGLACGHGER